MGKVAKVGKFLLVFSVALALTPSVASASFLVEVRDADGDATTQDVPQGGSVQLLINLSGDDSEFLSWKLFLTESIPGLVVTDYDYPAGIFTRFIATDLSAAKGDISGGGSYTTTGNDKFEAALDPGAPGGTPNGAAGTLVTIDIAVPGDFPLGPVNINTNPLFFDLDLFVTETGDAGTDYVLNVTPEPATLALLGIGGLAGVIRRRRR